MNFVSRRPSKCDDVYALTILSDLVGMFVCVVRKIHTSINKKVENKDKV